MPAQPARGASAGPGRDGREVLEVTHDDVRIEVLADGAGPTVLLVPSLARDSHDYDRVATGLARRGYRVLRPMPRGTGRTRGSMDGATLRDLAADVAATIVQEGGGRAVVLGHAYGHYVARMTAAVHPALVRGVVCAGCAAREFPSSLSALIDIGSDPGRPEAERLAALQTVFFASGNDPSEWLHGWYPGLAEQQRAARDRVDRAEWWHVARSPVLDLQGAEDPFRPADSRHELEDEFGSELVSVAVVPGASHALLVEQPEAVVDAVASWMHDLPE